MYRKPVGHYGFFQAAIATLRLQPEDVLLEIGCGGGVLLDLVWSTVQRAYGIDHSPDMVSLARRQNEQASSQGRVGIVQGDIQALPWEKNTFTCVAGVEVLWFIEDLPGTLAELHRVLRPGGRLVFVTAAQPRSPLSRFVFRPWLAHLRFCSDRELSTMLKQAGFETIQVNSLNRSEHSVFAHQLAYAAK
jgi:ubiquinone/menaquinone biosynthesis C-methylase UbiE